VFITTDNRVKILDFGLAKLTQDQAALTMASALPTTPSPTEPGVVLGTVGYMAPEQVRGQPADHRADLFAFGAILYELVSGYRAFRRDTGADTMAAILNEEPADLRSGPRPIPTALVRVVDRCLERVRRRDFRRPAISGSRWTPCGMRRAWSSHFLRGRVKRHGPRSAGPSPPCCCWR